MLQVGGRNFEGPNIRIRNSFVVSSATFNAQKWSKQHSQHSQQQHSQHSQQQQQQQQQQ
jgi:hypothetical protein